MAAPRMGWSRLEEALYRSLVSGSIPSARFTPTDALRALKTKEIRSTVDVLPTLESFVARGFLSMVGRLRPRLGAEGYVVTDLLVELAAQEMKAHPGANALAGLARPQPDQPLRAVCPHCQQGLEIHAVVERPRKAPRAPEALDRP